MIIQQRIIADGFGHCYRLHTPDDDPIPVPIEPIAFHDSYMTWRFVCDLHVTAENWRGLVYRFSNATVNSHHSDADIRKSVSNLLIQGRIKLYPVAHLAPSAESIEPVRIAAGKGESYRIIPASVLLVNPHHEVMPFHEKQDAEHFLKTTNLSAEQLGTIAGLTGTKNTENNEALIEALLTGKLAIVKVQGDASSSVKSEAVAEPAGPGPGNRPATLGPHVQGDKPAQIRPEPKKYSATSGDTIEARKRLAHDFYKEQGMPEHKIEAHMEGIDFAKPVDRVTLEKGTLVEQHQIPNASQGNYYAPVGTDARQLGIGSEALDKKTGQIVARQPKKYILKKDTEVLSSSAKAIEDTWSIPGQSIKTDGGGTQFFTMKSDNFTPG